MHAGRAMAQKGPRKRLKFSDIVVGAIATEAGGLCIGDRKHGSIPGPIGPGIVCMSFAVELWFKALALLMIALGASPTRRLCQQSDRHLNGWLFLVCTFSSPFD